MDKIIEVLNAVGLPFVFNAFPDEETPTFPFIVYETPMTNQFYADGIVFFETKTIVITLYTQLKDIISEQLIKDKLTEFGFGYTNENNYDYTEKVYSSIFRVGME